MVGATGPSDVQASNNLGSIFQIIAALSGKTPTTSTQQGGTTTSTQTGGDSTTVSTMNPGDISYLQDLIAEMQAADYGKLLESVFQQAAGQIPGFQSAFGNAVGARSGGNGTVAAMLQRLLQQTSLAGAKQVSDATLQNQNIRSNAAANIAQATRGTRQVQHTTRAPVVTTQQNPTVVTRTTGGNPNTDNLIKGLLGMQMFGGLYDWGRDVIKNRNKAGQEAETAETPSTQSAVQAANYSMLPSTPMGGMSYAPMTFFQDSFADGAFNFAAPSMGPLNYSPIQQPSSFNFWDYAGSDVPALDTSWLDSLNSITWDFGDAFSNGTPGAEFNYDTFVPDYTIPDSDFYAPQDEMFIDYGQYF